MDGMLMKYSFVEDAGAQIHSRLHCMHPIQSTLYCTVFHCSVDETQKAENSQEKCQIELTEPTPTTRPVNTKLLTGTKK